MKRIKQINLGASGVRFGIVILPLLFLTHSITFGQEPEKKSDDGKKPLKPAFESAQLMDDQSVVVPAKGTLEFNIQHRFGTVENGYKDLWGIYGQANIRLGFSYVPVKNLSVGFGYTKLKEYLDLNAKYSILKQTKDWSMPVSVTLYGNTAINTQMKPDNNNGIYRYSYYAQLIIASRITPKLSLQVSPIISHFNAVDSLYSNNMMAVSFSGRYKISGQSSIMFNYTQPVTSQKEKDIAAYYKNNFKVQPGYTIGWEVATSGHAFQMFFTTYQGIIPQENIAYNQFNASKSQYLIGFNITRLWSF